MDLNPNSLLSVISTDGLSNWDAYGLSIYDEDISNLLDKVSNTHSVTLKYAIQHRDKLLKKPGAKKIIQYSANCLKYNF